jgi:hypothetical protein
VEPEQLREIEAFVNAFVRPEQRGRYLQVPEKFYSDIPQGLNNRLQMNLAVDVPRELQSEFIVEFLRTEQVAETCFVLGQVATDDNPRSATDAAIRTIDQYQFGGIACIESGKLAFLKGEDPGRFVLSTNPRLLKRLSTRIDAAIAEVDALKPPRARRGSRK